MTTKKLRYPILVLGVGNILLRDEGIGVRIIEQLQKIELPGNVEVIDGGTAGTELLDILSDRQKVIVVDAVQYDCPPGTVLRFSIEDLASVEKSIVSLHNIGIAETFEMAKLIGCEPNDVIIFGIKPERIDCGLEITEKMKSIIPQTVELILAELKSSGAA